MKFAISSNSPNTKTGYGVQTALLAERLHDAGHDVAIFATFGQQGSTSTWKPEKPRHPELWDKGIRVYQVGWHINGLDIIHNHALHWFDGDPLGGWIIILGDVWSLKDNPLLADYNVAAWAPVDHFPAPVGVLEFFASSKALPIAMSRFGERCFREPGLDPVYIPLAVDTTVYKPTEALPHDDLGSITGRQLLGVSEEVFLVGMVAMNKDPDDRKGFNEAFAAFAQFHAKHPDSVLYVHTDKNGMGSSFNLEELALLSRIPPHAIKFPDVYAYQMGFTAEMMAAAYTAFDVLLAPSHGEGFCVPLIEAQACGTPVIASDFSAQPELVGAGWKIEGQQFYEVAQKAFYMMPFIDGIAGALEAAYVADMDDLAVSAIAKAHQYDADLVFEEYWRPLLRQMTADPVLVPLDRDEPFHVTAIVPVMRDENLPRLIESFANVNDGTASICLVVDGDYEEGYTKFGQVVFTGKEHTTYAEKVNLGFAATETPWVFLCGDDVQFQLGWIEEARKLSDRFDVIGTNDSLPPRIRNVEVASGDHADHFFVRRAYVTECGACLDGPGVLAPEAYNHWYVDKEIIELAKARNTFSPCLTSVVEHLHPGYDGREDLRAADETYMRAVEHGAADQETWETRKVLIAQQRQSRGRR